MWITDNESIKGIDDNKIRIEYPTLLEKLSNKTIDHLAKSTNLLIFPNDIFKSDNNLAKDSMIIKSVNNKYKFQNVVGFIGCGNERLDIHSRFSSIGKNDNFLHYMLRKVLNINVINLDTKASFDEELYNLLKYIFPSYLEAALKKGILKQYKRVEYNDANIKGSIDIARHIKMNTPFVGRIAYSTREFTGDNYVIQLIRHTIEFIKASSKGSEKILNTSDGIRQDIASVVTATPTYNVEQRQKIIAKNQLNPVSHAYYTEYQDLQRLCIMILNHSKHNLGSNNAENIHGVIFDVAWLWEEYLNKVMSDKDIIHPHNRKGINDPKDNRVYVFETKTDNSAGRRRVYPDFYSKTGKFVIDAKYKKRLDNDGKDKSSKAGVMREDLYQMISYMYILKYNSANLVYPATTKKQGKTEIGTLNGYEATINKYGFNIPQDIDDYAAFSNEMTNSEMEFKEYIDSLFVKDGDDQSMQL